ESGTLISLLEPDSFHPLAGIGVQATAFLVRRPPSKTPQTLTLRCGGDVFWIRRLAPNLSSPPRLRTDARRSTTPRSDAAAPTVIVPVYRDADATRDCFDSLIKARVPDKP